MNRAQRRRLKRESGRENVRRTMREEDIQKLKTEARDDAIKRLWIIMMGFPMLVLHDHYGFGRKRLSDFVDYLIDTYDDFQHGYFDLEDLMRTIRDEAGVDVMDLAKGFEKTETRR